MQSQTKPGPVAEMKNIYPCPAAKMSPSKPGPNELNPRSMSLAGAHLWVRSHPFIDRKAVYSALAAESLLSVKNKGAHTDLQD